MVFSLIFLPVRIAWVFIKLGIKIVLFIVLVAAVAYGVLLLAVQPSNDRTWKTEETVLAVPEWNADRSAVTVRNVRNFTHVSETEKTPGYYDATYRLEDLTKVYFIVEPFAGYVGAAHTFLSFQFGTSTFLAASVEVRKEEGESFSAWLGLLRRFEIMYVLADERDILRLRANIRNDDVYVYPIKTTDEKARALFASVMDRAAKLAGSPEFYNTLTSNCTTNIAAHVNEISPKRIPWSLDLQLPETADRYAYELGLVDTDLPFEEARTTFRINERAKTYADDPAFSLRIRNR